jgi:hypothetical protein
LSLLGRTIFDFVSRHTPLVDKQTNYPSDHLSSERMKASSQAISLYRA